MAHVLKQYRFDPGTPELIARAAKIAEMSINAWVESELVMSANRHLRGAERPSLPLRSTPTKTAPRRKGPLDAIVEAAWPGCQAEALKHGKRWTHLTSDRCNLMKGALRELGSVKSEDLVRVVRGAAEAWVDDPEMRRKYLVPETLYRPTKVVKYFEAAKDQTTGTHLTPEELERKRREHLGLDPE